MGGERDSELFDRALRAYVEERVAEQERAVLTLLAYEDDPELDMPEADDDLPYEGSVPAEVVGLAKLRRRRRAAR